MLNPSKGAGQAEGLPLTHPAFLDACQDPTHTASKSGRPWVQVRRPHAGGPVVLCGQVATLHEKDVELFGVATAIGELWATGRNVRLCSGDGRCTCQADDAGAAC